MAHSLLSHGASTGGRDMQRLRKVQGSGCGGAAAFFIAVGILRDRGGEAGGALQEMITGEKIWYGKV